MATVKFNLRSQSKGKAQPISLIFRHQKLRVVYSTGLKVVPKYWSPDRQRVKNVTHVPERDRINNTLNQLQAEVQKWAVERIEDREVITADKLKQHLDDFTGRRPGPEKNLLAYFGQFVANSPTRILPKTGRPPAKSTVKQHRTTLATLSEFAKDYRRPVDFGTIDMQFYDDFISWLQGRDAAHNTIGKHIKVLITVLNAATEDGVNTNLTFRSKHFRVLKEEVHSIYLTTDELAAMANLDLSESPRLDRVRDLFLIGAWTGLRFSDFTKITTDNIRGGNIYLDQRKTGGAVVVPVLPLVAQILEKHGGKAPSGISNQKMNDYLKELGEMAGIDTPIIQGQTRGGEKTVRRVKKWELIGTHTARRSFATNAYKAEIPSITIMKITGHKTEAAFLKYIKVSKEEHAEIFRKHWGKLAAPQMKAV